MSTVLVIGNGFDLALGYDTSYADFVNTMGGAFWPFKNPDNSNLQGYSLHQHFYDYYNEHKKDNGLIDWIDIEGELYNYVAAKKDGLINDELVKSDKRSFFELTIWLYNYFLRHEELKYKHHPPKGEDKCVIELLHALNKCNSFKKAYTFNYTNLRNKLSKFGGFSEDRMPDITYIHGSIEESSHSVPTIVLGINTDRTLPSQYSFLQKINNVDADAEDLASDLALADEVIFYGLSMGRIDFDYFRRFFESVVSTPFGNPKKHITIFSKGNNVIDRINKNVFEMGIDVRDLKDHSYFKIIDTHDAEFEDNGHYKAFHKLLNRLKNK